MFVSGVVLINSGIFASGMSSLMTIFDDGRAKYFQYDTEALSKHYEKVLKRLVSFNYFTFFFHQIQKVYF